MFLAAGRYGLTTLSKSLLYVEVERQIEDLLVRKRYRVGDRIPPEAELVESLGVSRATVRAGLGRLVERGLLERRQGSGTFLVRPPEGVRLRNGLERLESYTVQAERLGLELGSRGLKVERVVAGSEEASALEVPEGTPLARVERVLLVDGEPAAWMLDVVPEEIMSAEDVREGFDPNAMLLDLLVSRGVPITYSKLLIDAELISPNDQTGKALELSSASAALSLVETMYLENGRPAQWSRNIFLPGRLDLHVVRELYEVRRLS